MSSSRANRRGILALLVGMAAFSGNDAVAKLLMTRLPLGEVMFARGIITSAILGALIVALRHTNTLVLVFDRRICLRALLDAVAIAMFTATLHRMPIANLSAIVLISPLVITALSTIFLGEYVGWRRWTAILFGFAGTLLIVKPAPGAFDVWAVVAVLCAIISACRDFVTRGINPNVPALAVSLTASVAITLIAAGLGFWETWSPIDNSDILLLSVMAAFLAAGNFFIVLAFRGVEISVVAPFRYSLLLYAGLAGFFIFGEVPDLFALLGAVMIVASGIYALHREQVRQRELSSKQPTSS